MFIEQYFLHQFWARDQHAFVAVEIDFRNRPVQGHVAFRHATQIFHKGYHVAEQGPAKVAGDIGQVRAVGLLFVMLRVGGCHTDASNNKVGQG